MVWMRVSLLSLLLVAGCSTESLLLRSAGTACSSSEQCESNLCYESVCTSPPTRDSDAPAAETDLPVDCAALCAELYACELNDSTTTEEECADFCDANPLYFPDRVRECAVTHLAEGACDEASFQACADGPIMGFFKAASAQICERISACCFEDESSPFGTVDECTELFGGLAGGFIAATELMGYLSFDLAVAESCEGETIATLASTECADLPADMGAHLGDLVSCEGLMTPHQGEGEPCGILNDGSYIALADGCTGDLLCRGEPEDMPTCERGVALGGACDSEDAKCGTSSACADGVCVKPAALGGACEVDSACESGACEGGACGVAKPMDCGS
jgi:hypothetical protein